MACLFIAAAPPIGFSSYLERHAADDAEDALVNYAARMISHTDQAIDESVTALAELFATGVQRCDAAAVDSMRRAMHETYVLREIAVIGADGTVLCGDAILASERWVLSELPATNASVAVSAVVDAETLRRSLAISFLGTQGRSIAAHFAPGSLGLDILPGRWRESGEARLELTDGTVFEAFDTGTGEASTAQETGGDAISVAVRSERYPINAALTVPRSTVMEPYQQLKAYALIVMGVFSAIVLGIAVTLVNKRPNPTDDIKAGIRRGEFIPYYQPVINLASGRLEGCEVLVRRRMKDGSIEVPASFIAQAEKDGQIIPLTRQLMAAAIADLGEIYEVNRHLSVAFNLCAQHFKDDGIVDDVEAIFGGSPLTFGQLVLEVTERFPLADMSKAKSVIGALQNLGAQVALDDAGTGHSGLAAIHRLGMDIVKIDKIFIDPIGADTNQAPIVDTLVALAKTFDMSVVAEGVETLDQVRYLRAKGVDLAQGYLFAPPLPASSFLALARAMTGGERHGAAGRAGAA